MTDEHLENTIQGSGDDDEAFDVYLPVTPSLDGAGATHVARMRGNQVGFLEVLGRTRIIANNRFNVSPIVGGGIAFLLITIPLARFTDVLIKRDQERMRAGGG